MIPGGQGLGEREDGKKVFFWNALPGEVVEEYEVTKRKTHYEEAIAVRLAERSPERVEPRDECFLATSPWQVVNYEYELKLKGELVQEMFREHGIEIAAPAVRTDGKDYEYRNKMEYALYWDKEAEKIRLAFHQRGSHWKVPVEKSSIERPEIWAEAQRIVDELNSRGEEARKYQSLLLRCNQAGKVAGGLYENRQPHPVFRSLSDTVRGQEYQYSPNGFFQINVPVYEMALAEIQKWVSGERVLDLYAGVGTIGLSVARGKELTLVECDKAAYIELERNAEEVSDAGETRTVTTRLAKSEEALEYIAPDETVIIDPPRAGCDEKLVERLLQVKPQRIIYLSCNPATQARDAKKLLDGYRLVHVESFNFFPHTPHIENLIVLEREVA